jgi:hypothetical protein
MRGESTLNIEYSPDGKKKIPFMKITRSNEMMQTENYRSVGGA